MKLIRVRIKNYRSILDSGVIELRDYSVLVGKNNEGKTNILNAISVAFQVMREFSPHNSFSFAPSRLMAKRYYSFDVDYPMDYQSKGEAFINNNPTSISLSFSLSEDEKRGLFKETRLTYNAPIEIIIVFEKTGVSINVARRRKDDEQSSKTKSLVSFIIESFGIIYIPTIRTSEQSMRIIEQIVSNGLSSLRHDEGYREAYELINKKEQEKLDEISANLSPIMKQFIPNVSSVKLDRGHASIRTMRRDIGFIIDDGSETSIEQKGDGIKSLIQIALLKETSETDNGIILIEEPESHLHSGAIHELCKVLQEISKKQQIVVTTHSPIFINSSHLDCNYIVNEQKCAPTGSLSDIRNVLGVHFSDSLFSSDCVVVVEGESDKKIYSHLLSLASPLFKKCLESGTISFVVTRGASKAPSFLSFMDQLLVRYFAIWDNDDEGVNSLTKCRDASLICENYRLIPRLNKKSVVVEDLIDQRITMGIINEKYHCDLGINSGKMKWSDYVLNKLKKLGIEIDASSLECDKISIAEAVVSKSSLAEIVNVQPYVDFIEGLADSILRFFGLIDRDI